MENFWWICGLFLVLLFCGYLRTWSSKRQEHMNSREMCQRLLEINEPSASPVAPAVTHTPFNVQDLQYIPEELIRKREAIIQEEFIKNVNILDEMIKQDWEDDTVINKIYHTPPTLYEIAQLLVNKAKERKIITYGELSHELGDRIIARALPRRLTQINDIAISHDVPLLSALVVTTASGMPGEGFFNQYAPELKEDQWDSFWHDKLSEIGNYNDWDNFLNQIEG